MQLHSLPNLTLKSDNSHNNVNLANVSSMKTLDLSVPHVMGILNVTPDSFSDGGQFNSVDAALRHCQQMLDEGATIIDIGGESTRPNATSVSESEECQRVVPVVEAIREEFGHDLWLSIDTSSPMVIEQAVNAGADIWNDVRALKREGAISMAAKLKIPVVLMHMRGEPTTMGNMAQYQDVVKEAMAELKERIDAAIKGGVERDKIIVDPGFGFAKHYSHHQSLLAHLSEWHEFELPILFGISRKRFLGEVLDNTKLPAFENHSKLSRDGVGMAAALLAVQQGASIIRTHNVGLTMQGLALWQQINSL